MLPKKWRFLVCMQCDISPKCCDILKKEPFTRYVKRLEESRTLELHRMKVFEENISIRKQDAMYIVELL